MKDGAAQGWRGLVYCVDELFGYVRIPHLMSWHREHADRSYRAFLACVFSMKINDTAFLRCMLHHGISDVHDMSNDNVTSSRVLSAIFISISSSFPLIATSTISDRDLPKFAHIPTKHLHSRNRVASNGPAWWLTVSWSRDRRIILVSFIIA